MRRKLSSGAKWENIVGYSRAVQIGKFIELAGTTAAKDGEILFPNDAYKQANYILQLFSDKLKELGSSMKDVVRTRIYLTNIEDWKAVGKAHGEFFSDIKPASTMLAVSALVDSKMLVEIEATVIMD